LASIRDSPTTLLRPHVLVCADFNTDGIGAIMNVVGREHCVGRAHSRPTARVTVPRAAINPHRPSLAADRTRQRPSQAVDGAAYAIMGIAAALDVPQRPRTLWAGKRLQSKPLTGRRRTACATPSCCPVRREP